jgi:protein tyrosine phosphatase (PTP) superfamily phosphohydrolase (DUF442 family)
MSLSRRHALGAVAAFTLAADAASPSRRWAPNLVEIDPRLVTAGQPTLAGLGTLAAQGFAAVVYLAPFSVADAIREEPDILAAQGIRFVHLPVPFDRPAASHADALRRTLGELAGVRTLVHCQVNLRASSLVFLHRVIDRGDDPALAWEAVTRVWQPAGPWRRLIASQLRVHGIAFELD